MAEVGAKRLTGSPRYRHALGDGGNKTAAWNVHALDNCGNSENTGKTVNGKPAKCRAFGNGGNNGNRDSARFATAARRKTRKTACVDCHRSATVARTEAYAR